MRILKRLHLWLMYLKHFTWDGCEMVDSTLDTAARLKDELGDPL